MRPLELTRSGLIGTVAVIVVAAVCVRLGLWQLERREDRLARNAALVERMAAPPVELERVPRDTAGLIHRRVEVRGRLDDARSIVLAGRSYNGAPGVHVLSPLRLNGGAILVNRGWLPSPDAATADLDAVGLEGDIELEGVLLPFPETRGDAAAVEGGFRHTWFRLDGGGIRSQYPYPVAPLYVLATSRGSAAEAAPRYPVMLEAPTPDPGPHLSYAIQWFSFATIFVVGWLILLVRRGGGDGEPVARP